MINYPLPCGQPHWFTSRVVLALTTGIAIIIAAAPLTSAEHKRGPSAGQPAVDYQTSANSIQWSWSDDRANPLYSLSVSESAYDVVMISDHSDRTRLLLTIKILAGDVEAYSWRGHRYSVFRLLGDRLFYVDFSPGGPGATLVAVDLAQRRELWRSPLRGVGKPGHSIYMNRVDIRAVDGATISFFGNETAGRYYEIKDSKTGETLGHRKFSSPPGTNEADRQ